jgi:hypothetical protein
VGIGGLLKNTPTHGITKEQHITLTLLYRWELWTVETNNLTHGITKAAHHLISCFIGGNWVELLKNTLTQVIRKKRAAHHLIPAHSGN